MTAPRCAAVPDVMARPPWHARPAEEILAELSGPGGLSPEAAARRLAELGPNALPEAPPRTWLAVFVRQFLNPLIYLLLVAAGLAIALGELGDAVVIIAVVCTNAAVGAYQESRAERSLSALRRMSELTTRVIRGGVELALPARALVPGDVIALAAGDAVPADARVLEVASVQVSEAALTGESVPVDKNADAQAADVVLADRRSMLFAGTLLLSGRVRAVVVETGVRTEVGHIARLTAGAREPATPLEQRIARFGRMVALAALPLFGLVVAIGLLRGMRISDIVLVAISQVVGMVPEGLPIAMTVALAVGVQRLAAHRTIVRRISAVETLGSISVICSDKTGTLTMNQMTVTTLHLPGRGDVAVTGVGHAPVGEVQCAEDEVADVRALARAAALCSDAALLPPGPETPDWRAAGDPTEAALLTLAGKLGMDTATLAAESPREAELAFDPTLRRMAIRHGGAAPGVVVKGALEALLPLCSHQTVRGQRAELDDGARAALLEAEARLAGNALRVLAVAAGPPGELVDWPTGLTLLGLCGQLDPPRAEVKAAVAACRAAGIRPIMITGDHATTGMAVARELDIARPGDVAVEGRELSAWDAATLRRELPRVAVFARVEPAQKLRLVEALQAVGEVVAMTGDGVNDAPALAQADVGVAMGRGGTEVAKQASQVVIVDDHFETIVQAVEQGRIVYRNLKKALLLLVSTSLAEIVILLAAMLLGYPPPLAAVQILWNNVVTEGAITVNLVMEPGEGDEMQAAPVPRREPLLTRALGLRTLLMSSTITLVVLGTYFFHVAAGYSAAHTQTATFTVLAVCEWYNVLNCRSATRSAFDLSVLRNRWLMGGLLVGNLLHAAVVFVPPLNRIFRTVAMPWWEVLLIGASASLVLWVEEVRKLLLRRRLRLRASRDAARATSAATSALGAGSA